MGTLQLQDLYIDDEDQAYFAPALRSISNSTVHRINSSYDRCTTPVRSSSLSKSYHTEEQTEELPRRPALIPSPGSMRKYNTWRTATEPGPYVLEALQQGSQYQGTQSLDKSTAKVRRMPTPHGHGDQTGGHGGVQMGSNMYTPQHLSHSQPSYQQHQQHQQPQQYAQHTGACSHPAVQALGGQSIAGLTSSMPVSNQTLRAKSPSDGLRRSKSRGVDYSTKIRDRYEMSPSPLPSLTNQIMELTRRKRGQDPLFSEPRLALPNANTYARAGVLQTAAGPAANPHFAGWKPKGLRTSTTATATPPKQQGLASLPVLSKMHQ